MHALTIVVKCCSTAMPFFLNRDDHVWFLLLLAKHVNPNARVHPFSRSVTKTSTQRNKEHALGPQSSENKMMVPAPVGNFQSRLFMSSTVVYLKSMAALGEETNAALQKNRSAITAVTSVALPASHQHVPSTLVHDVIERAYHVFGGLLFS